MNRSLLARTARGAWWSTVLRLGTRALGFLSTLVLARLLPPADFGLVALALAALGVVDTLAFIGIDEALIREHAADRALYDTGFTLQLLRGIAVGAVMAALAPVLAGVFGQPRLAAVLYVLAAAVAVEGAANIALVDYWRAMAFERELVLSILPRLLGAVLAIGIAVAAQSYWALVAGAVVQRVLRVALSYAVHPFRPRLSLAARGALLGYSVWNAALSAAVVLRDRAAAFLTGRTLGGAPLGVFTLGWDLASMPIAELVAPLSRAAYSAFAAARHEGEDLGRAYLRVSASAALIVMPAGWGISLVAAPLVRLLYGPHWDAAVPVVQVLGAVCGSTVFGYLAWTVVYAQARLGTCFAVCLAAALLRVALLAVLLPRIGVIGAAWATAASLALEAALYLGILLRGGIVSAGALLAASWRTVAGVAAMAAALAAAGLGWAPGEAPQLALAVPAGGMVYAGTVMILWFLSGRPQGAEADALALLRRRLPFRSKS